MIRKMLPLAIAAVAAMTAWSVVAPVQAHKGAHGVVKERMKAMMRMEKGLRRINLMAQGKAAFDAKTVRERAAALRRHARRIPELFPPGTHKHPSEASPTIWQHFDDFRHRAARLSTLAEALGKATERTLPDVLRQVQATCKGCHERYRIERDD